MPRPVLAKGLKSSRERQEPAHLVKAVHEVAVGVAGGGRQVRLEQELELGPQLQAVQLEGAIQLAQDRLWAAALQLVLVW